MNQRGAEVLKRIFS